MSVSFLDGGYRGGDAQRAAYEERRICIAVIVSPKSGVVEQNLGWINRAIGLVEDPEATVQSSLVSPQMALAFLLTQRLVREILATK